MDIVLIVARHHASDARSLGIAYRQTFRTLGLKTPPPGGGHTKPSARTGKPLSGISRSPRGGDVKSDVKTFKADMHVL